MLTEVTLYFFIETIEAIICCTGNCCLYLRLKLKWTLRYENNVCCYLANKGENIGEEEREPADKEDDENDYKSLGSLDIVSQGLMSRGEMVA